MTRGRRPDPTLAPSRQLLTQRAFRQRRAAHLAGLQQKVEALEEENRRLSHGESTSSCHLTRRSPSVSAEGSEGASKRARRESVKSEASSSSQTTVAAHSDRHPSSSNSSACAQSDCNAHHAPASDTCHRCRSFEDCRADIDSLVQCVGTCLSKLQAAIASLQQRNHDETCTNTAASSINNESITMPPPLPISQNTSQAQSAAPSDSSKRSRGDETTNGTNSLSASSASSRKKEKPATARQKQAGALRLSQGRPQSAGGVSSSAPLSPAGAWQAWPANAQVAAGMQPPLRVASTAHADDSSPASMSSANGMQMSPHDPRLMLDAGQILSRSFSMSNDGAPISQHTVAPPTGRHSWQGMPGFRQFDDYQGQQQGQHTRHPQHIASNTAPTEGGHFSTPVPISPFEIPNLTLPMQFSQASIGSPQHFNLLQQNQQNQQSQASSHMFTQSELNAVDDLGGDTRKCCLGFFECDSSGTLVVHGGEDGTAAAASDQRPANATTTNGTPSRMASRQPSQI